MVPLAWDDRYLTGVGFIDESHRRIFQLINALESPGRRSGDPSPEEALALFVDYAGRHFEEEEELMGYLEYPGLQAHRADHQRATAWIATLGAEAREGKLDAQAIAAFAGEWVHRHIQDYDFPLIEWVRAPRSAEVLDYLKAKKAQP